MAKNRRPLGTPVQTIGTRVAAIGPSKVYGNLAKRNSRGPKTQREINEAMMAGRRGVPITLHKVSILESDP